MSPIQILKLLSGEEIIAEVAEVSRFDGDEKKYVLNNPRFIMTTSEGLGLFPLGYGYAKPPESIYVRSDHIYYSLVPSEEILDHYKKLTGRIVTPPSQIITP
jgi:hypothetical protein